MIRFRHSVYSTIAKKRKYSQLNFPGSKPFKEAESEKWLGYILTADLKDDKHIISQTGRLYCATNQIIDNVKARHMNFQVKRSIIYAYGCIYLVGALDNYTQGAWNTLKTAHRYLVRNITGMFDRDEMLYDEDPDMNHEYTGVRQLMTTGTLYPDTRSRWPYTKYRVLTVDGLQSKARFRLDTVLKDPH